MIVKQELKKLIELYNQKLGPFDIKKSQKYYEKFMLIKGNNFK